MDEVFGVIGICGPTGNLTARVIMDNGFQVIGTDVKSREECDYLYTLDDYDIKLFLKGHPDNFFDSLNYVIPPISLSKNSKLLLDIEKQIEYSDNANKAQIISVEDIIKRFKPEKPVIFVTGTNGKTTTVSLLKHLCNFSGLKTAEHNFKNLQGNAEYIPPLQARLNGDVAVLETGIMGKKGDLKFIIDRCEPSAGIITNITPDHLNGGGDFLRYAKVKGELIENLKGKQLIINSDDPTLVGLVDSLNFKGDLITFGIDHDVTYENTKKCWCGRDLKISETIAGVGYYSCECGLKSEKPMYTATNIQANSFTLLTPDKPMDVNHSLLGLHNVYNAVGSIIAAREFFKISDNDILNSIKDFKGVPGRLEYVSKFQGKDIIIDYGHNPYGVQTVLTELKKIYPDKKIAAVITIASESGKSGDMDILTRSLKLADYVIPASFCCRKAALKIADSPKIILTDTAPSDFRKGLLGATSEQVVEGFKKSMETDADVVLCLGEAAFKSKNSIKSCLN
ncbi:MAG: Mur ligase family protein [Methanomicrobiales archaeon]